MFKRIKEFLNPAPKYACTPEERYYAQRGISEPIIAILKSMDERSRDWKVRRSNCLSSYPLMWFNIQDKKTGLSFSVTCQKGFMNSDDDSIQIATGSVIFWVTHKEEQAITEKLEELYLKRLNRLKIIQTISENKIKQKLRNEWKEKYQC